MNELTAFLIVVAVLILTIFNHLFLWSYIDYSRNYDNMSKFFLFDIRGACIYVSLVIISLIFIPYTAFKVCYSRIPREDDGSWSLDDYFG